MVIATFWQDHGGNIIAFVVALTGLVGVAAGTYAFFRYNSYKATVSLQNDNIKALQDQAEIHTRLLAEQGLQIVELKARNNVVESLPLKEIFKSLQQIHGDVLLLAKASKVKE